MKFEPGKSGNPKGRPKRSLNAPDIRKLLAPHAQTFLAKLLELLNHKDPRVRLEALKLFSAYLWGKPPESIEHRGLEEREGITIVLDNLGGGKTASLEAAPFATIDGRSRDEAGAALQPAGEAVQPSEHGAPERSQLTTLAHREKRDVLRGLIPDPRGAGAPHAMPRIGDRGISPGLNEAMRRRLGRDS